MGEKPKVCPLILSGNTMARNDSPCIKTDCAWWDAATAKCAILTIAEAEAATVAG